MKMTFAQAWGMLAVGDAVSLRNGAPPPPDENCRAYNLWRACNFDGTVEALEDGDPPRIRVGFVTDFGSIALHVADSPGLTIEVTSAADLATARLRRWEAAKQVRSARIDAGCVTPLGRVDTDEVSRLNISGAVQAATIAQAAGQSFAIDWTMADDSVVTHDAAAMIAMGLAVAAYVSACHDAARGVRDAIDAAADLTALAAITIDGGYPE